MLLLLLATLIAFQPLSTDRYLPSMPSIAAGLGLDADADTDAGTVQATLSVCILGFAFTQLPAGRLLQSVGTCCTVVCAHATVRDRYDLATGARRLAQAMSRVALMPLAAPIAGGLLGAQLGWRAAFATMTGFVQNMVAACAGALIGRLHDGRALPMSGMVAAAGVAAAVVAQTLVRRHDGVDAGPLPAAAR